jgi:hypothetical protein
VDAGGAGGADPALTCDHPAEWAYLGRDGVERCICGHESRWWEQPAPTWSPVPYRAYTCLPGWCSRYPEPCPVCSPGEVPEPSYQGESLQQREHRVSRMADMALVHEALDDLGVPRDLLRARLAYLRGLVAGLREGR